MCIPASCERGEGSRLLRGDRSALMGWRAQPGNRPGTGARGHQRTSQACASTNLTGLARRIRVRMAPTVPRFRYELRATYCTCDSAGAVS